MELRLEPGTLAYQHLLSSTRPQDQMQKVDITVEHMNLKWYISTITANQRAGKVNVAVKCGTLTMED